MSLLFNMLSRASLVAQKLKHLPGMWETGVRSLGREDPLEKEMATHSSPLSWRIPWREEPGRLQSVGSQSQTRLSDFTFQVGHSFSSKEQVSFNFMAALTICSDLEPKKIKPVTVSIVSPSVCHKVMRLDAMILVF